MHPRYMYAPHNHEVRLAEANKAQFCYYSYMLRPFRISLRQLIPGDQHLVVGKVGKY
jgi:hypothetical protein